MTGNSRHEEGSAAVSAHSLPQDSTASLPPPPKGKLEGSKSAVETSGHTAENNHPAVKDTTQSKGSHPPPPKHSWKLKGMVAVVRHADRTPKQKFKFTFHTKPFIDLLKGHEEEVLLIGEAALSSVLDAVEVAMREKVEDQTKLSLLKKSLLAKGGIAWHQGSNQAHFPAQEARRSPSRRASLPGCDGSI